MLCFAVEVRPFSVMMRSFPTQLSLSPWSPCLCGEVEFWQSADLMPAGVQAGWGYSAGIQLVSVGYSGGCRKGQCLPSFVRAKRPRKKKPSARMHPHTWAHTHKRLEDLPKSLFRLTQVSWFPRATSLHHHRPPLPLFFFSFFCWEEPIVRRLVTRHPIYQ